MFWWHPETISNYFKCFIRGFHLQIPCAPLAFCNFHPNSSLAIWIFLASSNDLLDPVLLPTIHSHPLKKTNAFILSHNSRFSLRLRVTWWFLVRGRKFIDSLSLVDLWLPVFLTSSPAAIGRETSSILIKRRFSARPRRNSQHTAAGVRKSSVTPAAAL